ncbi:uncharacterized protein LOC105690470 [Athalia rosae]|uniref:uncharacterized protein LOC105690470 n=1 Tax=Athalia rosae TaxID=37344 RepID=UPI0020335904|nr:uncharacterized protein LOC105690470 [Athalia rosae]
MTRFQVLLVLTVATAVVCSTGVPPSPSYTKTMLKVGRSLPGETEEVKVRTSEGGLATLIVKRRERVNQPEVFSNANQNESNQSSFMAGGSQGRDEEAQKRVEKEHIARIRDQVELTVLREVNPVNEQGKSEVKNFSQSGSGSVDHGSWIPLGSKGRVLAERNEEIYTSWKPVEAEQKTTNDERTSHSKYSKRNFQHQGSLSAERHSPEDRNERNLLFVNLNPQKIIGNEDQRAQGFLPSQPRPLTRTNIGANIHKNRNGKNVPPEVIIRSVVNVKPSAKRTPMTLDADGIPTIHGQRVPDDPMDKIQTWRNARVINNKLIPDSATVVTLEAPNNFFTAGNAAERQRFENFFDGVNRRYGRHSEPEGRNVYFEWDPKNYQNDALKAEVYNAMNDNYNSNVQKRMLHPESVANYPNSQTYMPESQKIAPVALKPGVRAPVLQYAHPELGVQPAKIVKNDMRQPENFENQQAFSETRQKKKYVLNDKNVVDFYSSKLYYPNQRFYGLKPQNDQPFWVKISENLKNQFSTGVEKVSRLTRPVFDPLVEATQKISKNLGLSRDTAQNKVGTVASSSSILIPALGLVASGAALGIGAVAVGRYLDVDVLKRSNEKEIDLEHKRAMESVAASNPEREEPTNEGQSKSWQAETFGANRAVDSVQPVENFPIFMNDDENLHGREDEDGVFLVLEESNDSDKVEDRQTRPYVDELEYVETRRHRRSIDNYNVFGVAGTEVTDAIRDKRLQRKNLDRKTEIVEIDSPGGRNIDLKEFLLPTIEYPSVGDEGTILVVESPEDVVVDRPIRNYDQNRIANVANTVDEIIKMSEIERDKKSDIYKRSKRSLSTDQELQDTFQNLENAEVAEAGHVEGDWTNTPCAKRIFCDAMILRGPDAVMFMEKKMASLLALIQPGAANQVSSHFEEVIDAIRRHDCSGFLCPQARPGNVFF